VDSALVSEGYINIGGILDKISGRRIQDWSSSQALIANMSCHTAERPDQRCKTSNLVALPLWLLGSPIGLIFDNSNVAACLSDVQPRQIVSIRTDASVLLALKALDMIFVSASFESKR